MLFKKNKNKVKEEKPYFACFHKYVSGILNLNSEHEKNTLNNENQKLNKLNNNFKLYEIENKKVNEERKKQLDSKIKNNNLKIDAFKSSKKILITSKNKIVLEKKDLENKILKLVKTENDYDNKISNLNNEIEQLNLKNEDDNRIYLQNNEKNLSEYKCKKEKYENEKKTIDFTIISLKKQIKNNEKKSSWF